MIGVCDSRAILRRSLLHSGCSAMNPGSAASGQSTASRRAAQPLARDVIENSLESSPDSPACHFSSCGMFGCTIATGASGRSCVVRMRHAPYPASAATIATAPTSRFAIAARWPRSIHASAISPFTAAMQKLSPRTPPSRAMVARPPPPRKKATLLPHRPVVTTMATTPLLHVIESLKRPAPAPPG